MKSSRNSITEEEVKKIISQILRDSAKPLSDDITKAVLDVVNVYIIDFRRRFLENMEFVIPKTASKRSGIPLVTIYTWIARGLLMNYTIGSTNYISMTQLNSIPYHPKPRTSTLEDTILPP